MKTGNYNKRPFKRDQRIFYTLNERIQAPSFRLIDDQGKQVGILNKYDALKMAQEQQLDLVLIAEKANPPVVKIIDFNKFLYQESKKQKEARKGVKKSTVKDLKLSLFIGRGDFERLAERAKEFLKDGYQVRVGLLLKGREIAKKQMAFDLIKEFFTLAGDINIVSEPKIQGRVIIAVISRKKE